MTNKSLSDEQIKQLTARAASLVVEVPEDLRGAAFQKVFDTLMTELLTVAHPTATEGRVGRSSLPSSGQKADPIDQILEKVDRTRYPAIRAEGKALDLALLILRLARDEFQADWLMPSDISRVLSEKFRIGKSTAAIRMAISESPHVDRKKRKDGNYEYRLMQAGDDYLDGSGSGGDKAARAKPMRRRSKGGHQRDASADTRPATGKQGASSAALKVRSRTSSAGPLQLLMELVTEKFFSQPQTIGSIIEHLAHKKARTVRATDLSPALVRLIRKHTLTRSKNSTGQYEYLHE